jgi:carbonic anhydrase
LASSASAAGGQYDYKKQGADWPDLKDVGNNECGGTNQSPIDLPLSMSPDKTISWEEDHFSKIYNNIENAEVKWTS